MRLHSEHDGADPAVRSLLIVHNPVAGGRRGRFERTLAALRALGCDIEVRATAARGDAEAIARAAASAQGVDRVVVAGGDGTVNEAIQGLAGGGLPLALIPLGTANVLAQEIGLGSSPEAIARTVVGGRVQTVGLGRIANCAGARRYFAQMAGVGVDAHAVARVDLGLKRRLGKGAYYLEALRQFWVFPFAGYRVRVDGTLYESASAVVARGRFYAGRYVLAPAARLENPVCHVCLFETAGRMAALRYALAMQLGRLTALRDYRIVTGRRIEIDGPDGDPVQADGDDAARLPVEIDVVPGALRLVVPTASDV